MKFVSEISHKSVKIWFEDAAQAREISYWYVEQTREIRQAAVAQTYVSGIHKAKTGTKYLVNSSWRKCNKDNNNINTQIRTKTHICAGTRDN